MKQMLAYLCCENEDGEEAGVRLYVTEEDFHSGNEFAILPLTNKQLMKLIRSGVEVVMLDSYQRPEEPEGDA